MSVLAFIPLASWSADYYVNDTVTNGDVYCSAPGNDTNTGTSASSPLLSIATLISTKDLEPNDVVYIDTGSYTNYTISIGSDDSGSSSGYVTFQGSTTDGGTIIDRANTGANGFVLTSASYLRFRNLAIKTANFGIISTGGGNLDYESVRISDCNQVGFYINGTPNVMLRRCAVLNTTIGTWNAPSATNTSWDQSIFWNNSFAIDNFERVTISNSIIVGGTAFRQNKPTAGDYNIFWDTDLGFSWGLLSEMQADRGSFFNSTVMDPLFVNASATNLHLRSVVGTYSNGTFVTYTNHSPAIDFGDPVAVFTNETAPNGSNVNVGTYGNTALAARSRTNRWLLALSYNDGGLLSGATNILRWRYGAFTNGSLVNVQYSTNGSSSWTSISNNVPVTNRQVNWNVTGLGSIVASWRVVSATDSNTFAVGAKRLAINGARPPYYVNDASTAGDTYCTAAGSTTNTGLTPGSPMLTLQALFTAHVLGPGDIVYVDTGVYSNETTTVPPTDSGSAHAHMTIQGSTNIFTGITVLDRNLVSSDVLVLNGSRFVEIRNMEVRDGRFGINIGSASIDVEVFDVRSFGNSRGFYSTSPSNRFIRCVAANNAIGAQVDSAGVGASFENFVAWSNDTAFSISPGVALSNSIIVGGTAFSINYPSSGDYNIFWKTALGYPTLNELQEGLGIFLNSTVLDPLLANPSAGLFHPRSVVGTYSNGTFSTYAEHSPCIDLGAPSASFTNEPSPNGGRINIGNYGDTVEASKSRTNAWLQVLSFTDGGTLNAATGSTDYVYWTSGNFPTGALVSIEVSLDSGNSWLTVQTNIPATAGSYLWSNTNYPSSRFARWRVVSQSDTNVLSATTVTNFTYRNGPFVYYVNDALGAGDMYCTAQGNDANLGTAPASPKASISSVLSTHDLEPGDIILIDTGLFPADLSVTIDSGDSGTAAEPVLIVGSTNVCAGGSTIIRATTLGAVFDGVRFASSAAHVHLKNLTVLRRLNGIGVEAGATGLVFEGISVISNGLSGISVAGASGVSMRRILARANEGSGISVSGNSGVAIENSVMWKNNESGLSVAAGVVTMTNSVIGASGQRAQAISAATTTNVISDFNCLFVESNAVVATIASVGRNADTLSAWTAFTGRDGSSLDADPLFEDPDGGDFHEETETSQGRHKACIGLQNDIRTSPLIDAGAKSSVYTNEAGANGARINIGLFGNTAEASRGRSDPWLLAASLGGGGWVQGTSRLHWVAGNISTSDLVRVDYTTNGGASWTVLSNNISGLSESVTWNTTLVADSPACYWRVILLSDTNVSSQTTNFFSIRNAPLNIYVDDGVTNGNAFATGVAGATNWVASAAAPLNSLQSVLNVFNLEPGDRVFIDTGVYTSTANLGFGRLNSGISTSPVVIVGSTNRCAGGSTLVQRGVQSEPAGMTFNLGRWVTVSNLTLDAGAYGIHATDAGGLVFDRVVVRSNTAHGFYILTSSNITFQRSAALKSSGFGFNSITNSGVSVVQSISISNTAGGIQVHGGSMQITNSVLSASGPGAYVIYLANSAVVRSDYNNFLALNTATVARTTDGLLSKSLASWQQRTTNDLRSLSHSPGFADAGAGDFHLRSEIGRYSYASCGIVTDAVGSTSFLIDSGNPTTTFTNEPAPNGGRVNIGMFGNSAEASRSRTNGWILALTLNDGGTIRGTNAIFWVAGGSATGDLVAIDFSIDNGLTWTNVTSNLVASAGVYTNWDTTINGSTPAGRWRVRSQSSPAVIDTNDTAFLLNNGPLTFYVNDTNTTGDAYCIAAGAPGNDGLTAASPALTPAEILSRYDMPAGTRILMDTGVYTMPSTLTFDSNTRGELTNLVQVIGSTNEAFGGTVLDRLRLDGPAVRIAGTAGISLSNLKIINGRRGVDFDGVYDCVMHNVSVVCPPTLNEGPQSTGFYLQGATNVQFRHCAVSGVTNFSLSAGVRLFLNSQQISWTHGVLWSNSVGVRVESGSDISVSNSVFGTFGSNAVSMVLSSVSAVNSDYNNFLVTGGAMVASSSESVAPTIALPLLFPNLADWVRLTGKDGYSLSLEPQYVSTVENDFHPASVEGRFLPGTGFVNDTNTSPLVDAGAPTSVFTNEPAPNGGRVNIGRYGNTAEASKTPTNAAFTVISLNDGGIARGTNQTLRWLSRGAATGQTVRLHLSTNDGLSYVIIVTNLPAGTVSYSWNTTNFPSTLRAKWNVGTDANFNGSDLSDAFFALRNTNFTFYVNDGSTNNDIYCSAAGSQLANGLSPLTPMASLQAVLDAYDVEAGDTIYVDTGFYTQAVDVVLSSLDGGSGTGRVFVTGSPATNAGGTRLIGHGVSIQGARSVTISDIDVDTSGRGGGYGLEIRSSTGVVARSIVTRGSGVGLNVQQSADAQLERCVAIGAFTSGVAVVQSIGIGVRNSVLWSNAVGVSASGGMSFSNNVIYASGSNKYGIVSAGSFASDYNCIFVTNSALPAQSVTSTPARTYESVARWSKDSGADYHSLSHDPKLADPATGDFHPKSQAGRYENGTFVLDAETSPLIDASDSAWPVGSETAPNGARHNIGLYGGTAQASRTPTNAALVALSFNDGGIALGSSVALNWNPRGDATGQLVRVDLSINNGLTWTTLVSGLSASVGTYTWDTTALPSTPIALWRVVSLSDTNVFDVVDKIFAIRNGPISFYVNDASTTGDVYSTAIGATTNQGISGSAPKSTLQDVLQTYDIEPGDIIYVDTGTHTVNSPIRITQLDAGDPLTDTMVTIQGSTNTTAGGTILHTPGTFPIFDLAQSSAMRLKDMKLRGGTVGVRLTDSGNCVLQGLDIEEATTGILMTRATALRIENCIIRESSGIGIANEASAGVQLKSSVLWSNALAAVDAVGGSLSITGTSISAFTTNAVFRMSVPTLASFASDYNNFELRNGAVLAEITIPINPAAPLDVRPPLILQNVARWSRDMGRDRHSLSHDPLFNNPTEGDFRLKSAGGRYNPATASFTNDAVTSPLIDAGPPLFTFSSETAPNGGRADIGAYANHPQASRTPTNGSLTVVSLNDGGRAEGEDWELYWVPRGSATGQTVRLEYSSNGGVTWTPIATNWPASSGALFWDTATYASSIRSSWRIVSEANTSVYGTVSSLFALRNEPLNFYVNDISTAGDMYTTAGGLETNLATAASLPNLSLQYVLDSYDLEPGDTIYVDTGSYPLNSQVISIDRFDAWDNFTNITALEQGQKALTILGSTNVVAGGTAFRYFQVPQAVTMTRAYGVALYDLRLEMTPVGSGNLVKWVESHYGSMTRLVLRNGVDGALLENSNDFGVSNCLVTGNSGIGVSVLSSDGVDINHCVIWSNRIGAQYRESSGDIPDSNVVKLRNSMLGAFGVGRVAQLLLRSDLQSDYNCIFVASNALVAGQVIGGTLGGGTNQFQKLFAWTAATGNDSNSIVADPRYSFALTNDFHERSPAGYFVTALGMVTNGSSPLSPLVDGGEPLAPFGNEEAANGSRANIGIYGNTAEAAKTPTNGILRVLSYNDGGRAQGDVTLRWVASGAANTHLVTIDFSADGGETWTNIASNVAASQQAYLWQSDLFPRAAAGNWRIVSQNDATLASTNQNLFQHPGTNGIIPYYVNDTYTPCDVYTTASGNDENTGYIPSKPKATLSALLEEIDFEAGDVVFIDSGTYTLSEPVTIGIFDAGVATNAVVFQGSTNFACGGTVFNASGVEAAFKCFETEAIAIRDLTVKNGVYGVLIEKTAAARLSNVRSEQNSQAGFAVSGSLDVEFTNCVSYFNGQFGLIIQNASEDPASARFTGGVIWRNTNAVHIGQSSDLSIRNSALQAFGGGRVYDFALGASIITSDYNNIVRQSGAIMAELAQAGGRRDIYGRLIEWQRVFSNDLHSLSHTPLFADEFNGDFHLKSAEGRILPDATLTNDPPGTFSPMLDAGDPSSPFTNEPAPNGGRINIGAYGNTPVESRSQTNPWLLAVTINDGGLLFGTNVMRWLAGGMATSETVRFEFAANGVDYLPVITNIPAYQGEVVWDASALPPTALARWRIVSESNPAVADPNNTAFVVKNSRIDVYINDSSTNCDVYTTSIGISTNDGLSSATPLDDICAALNRYPLGAGDAVYIDTGVYNVTCPGGLIVGLNGDEVELGVMNLPILIKGSTNYICGGSIIVGSGTNGTGLLLRETEFVDVEDLTFRGASYGIRVQDSDHVNLRRIRSYNHILSGFRMSSAQATTIDYCSAWSNGVSGIAVEGSLSSVEWNHGVLWSNASYAVEHIDGQLSVNNSVLHSEFLIYFLGSLAAYSGDYNCLFTGVSGALAVRPALQISYNDLMSWQVNLQADLNSVRLDPQLFDPANGDFHEISSAGRFDPSTGLYVTNDVVASWIIDAGSPSEDASTEPAPNGGRINIGLHGGTEQASKTETNASQKALRVVRFNDGGTGSNVVNLTWLNRAMTSNDLVYIEVSTNAGLQWVTIATNVPANQNLYVWTPTNFQSTPSAFWRLTHQTDNAIAATNAQAFKLRLSPIYYYVNDSNTLGDIYALAAGSATNDGLTPAQPRDSIDSILRDYDLEGGTPLFGGDVIFVDTGTYYITNTIRVLNSDAGSTNGPVIIQGSSNVTMGGSIVHYVTTNAFGEENSELAFEIFISDHISLRDLTFENANTAIKLDRTDGTSLRKVIIRDGGIVGIEANQAGFEMERSVVTRLTGAALVGSLSSIDVNHSVIWSNEGGCIVASATFLGISNSVLHAMGSSSNVLFDVSANTTLRSDFNNLFVQSPAHYGRIAGALIEGLPQWTKANNQDRHSVSSDPLFADPANDGYHERSASGRYDPGSALFVTTDTNFSYNIDTGTTNSPYSNETFPNGARVNIGLYGDSQQASRSRTNEWVMAVTASSGGRANGIFYLVWAWGFMDPTNRVYLEHSLDDGSTWSLIESNLLVSTGEYLWDSESPLVASPIARWRILRHGNTNVYDVTDRNFALNGPFTFYMNDTSLLDDVFTSAIGSDTNLGIYPHAPKLTLPSLLQLWDIEGEDRVLIDAGVHSVTTNTLISLDSSDGGSAGRFVTLAGVTNSRGSIFNYVSSPPASAIISINGSYVVASNLVFNNGGLVSAGTENSLSRITVTNGSVSLSGGNGYVDSLRIATGSLAVAGQKMRASRVTIRNGAVTMSGASNTLVNSIVQNGQGTAVTVNGADVDVHNNTLLSSGTVFRLQSVGSFADLRNNIIVADGGGQPNTFCIIVEGGVLASDYNNLIARNGAWIGSGGGGSWEKLLYWQRASGLDLNSISADPLFASESGFDLHLKSLTGRYTNGTFVADAVHSSSIDTGDPASDFSDEVSPDGLRVNLGSHGNTAEASLSRTGSWVLAVTANDGGVLRGEDVVLRWRSGNVEDTNSVTLQYSADGGATWTNIVNGLSVQTNQFVWNTTNYPSSLDATWRVVLDANTNIYDAVDQFFAVRNYATNFYVNNAATNNDVFTTAVGSSGNNGRTPSTPKATLADVVQTYDLEGNDQIYVDTGIYTSSTDIIVYWSDSGDSNGPVVIRGSTNFAAGGTVFLRSDTNAESDALEIRGSMVKLKDMTTRSGYRGVYMFSNRYSSVEGLLSISNDLAISFDRTIGMTARNVRVWNNRMGGVDLVQSITTRVENATFVNPGEFAIRGSGVGLDVLQNNIFYFNVAQSNAMSAYSGPLSFVDAAFIDYNIYYFGPLATNASMYGGVTNLLVWQRTRAKDYRSATTNPLLANVNSGDFHEQSTAGRYVDGTGFVLDTNNSFAVDGAHPDTAFALEPAPSGGRANAGAYGGTVYASKAYPGPGGSNVYFDMKTGDGLLVLNTNLNPYPIIWYSHLVPTNTMVNVEYSGDGGVTWIALATNISAYQEFILWDLLPLYNTYTNGRLRVRSLTDPSLVSTNDGNIDQFYGTYQISNEGVMPDDKKFIVWRGAWGEEYQVQHADGMVTGVQAFAWTNSVSGVSSNEQALRTTTVGGDFTYIDPASTGRLYRVYRVLLTAPQP